MCVPSSSAPLRTRDAVCNLLGDERGALVCRAARHERGDADVASLSTTLQWLSLPVTTNSLMPCIVW